MRYAHTKVPASFLTVALVLMGSACLKRPTLEPKKPEAKVEEPGQSLTPNVVDKGRIRDNLNSIFAPNYDCNSAKEGSAKSQLRLLTRDEYNNSVKDIFGIQTNSQGLIPQEQKVLGFKNNADVSLISSDHAAAYNSVARQISQEFVSSRWTTAVSCPVSAGQSCAESFLKDYAPLVWRRAVSDAEIQNLLQLYKTGAEMSPEDGMKLVIRGLLMSPHFLYRSELGQEGKLDAYERASALSFFFWNTTPDRELFRLAQSGDLNNDVVLLQQAQRLIQDERAKAGLKAFADAWLNYSAVLNVNKDAVKFPQFNSSLRQLLAAETEDFFNYVVRTEKAGFEELFKADYSLGNQTLADYYKSTLVTDGQIQKLNFANQNRRGILGHASILSSLAYATETGPIQRGVFVREHVLCEVMTPPPANLQIVPPAPREGATTRERFAEHTASPACSGCHTRIDGIGFGMEDFDAVGLLRSMDNGKPVDSSGRMVGLDGRDFDFNGTMELTQNIATSERAQKCMVVQTFRMAHGRLEGESDICSIRRMAQTFVDKKMSIADLLVMIATDASYTNRK
jgi:hypothetical protein